MTWVAVAVGGAAVIGAGASYAGSKKQSGASQAAANLNMDQFRLLNQQQQPYIQSGYGAMSRLNTLLGLSPNPNYRPQQTQVGQPYMPPAAGTQPTQMPPQQHGSFGIPENAQNMRLNRILNMRAQNGDTEAARILMQRMS